MTIISTVILARYFDKQDYGTYRQVMYVYNTFLVVFSLGLPKAYSYFLPRVPIEEAKSLISKINLVLLTSGVLLSVVIFFGAELIAISLNNENLIKPLKYFALVPLFMLPTMGLEGILASFQKTKFLALYNLSTKILTLIFVVFPVVILNGSINSAIIGFTLASFISFLIALYFKYLPVKEESQIPSKIKLNEILNYTIPIMLAGLWGVLISSADQFFISRYFGNEVFADFANGSLELPFVGMIVSASAIVLSPVFSKFIYEKGLDAKNEIIIIWRSVFEKTVKIIYPLVIFSIFFGDVIMIFLYGENYTDSGLFFQLKLIANFFNIIAYGPLLLSIGGNKYYYKVHMYGAIILVLLEWLSILIIFSPFAVVIVSIICQIGRIIAMLLFITNFFKIKFFDLIPIKVIVEILLPSLIFLFAIRLILYQLISNSIILLILSGMIYLVLFSIWSYYRKIDYYSILKPLFHKIKK